MSLGSLSIMTGGEISGNFARGVMEVSGGGGVYNEGNFAIYGGVITNNMANNYGGGVYNNKDFRVFGEGEVYANTAAQKGNNIYNYNNLEGYIVPIVSIVLVIVVGCLSVLFYYKRVSNKK